MSATQDSAGPRTRAQRVKQESTNLLRDPLPALIVGQGHTQRLLLQLQRAIAWRALQTPTLRLGAAVAYVKQAILEMETLPAQLARLVNSREPRDLTLALIATRANTRQKPRPSSAPTVRQTLIHWQEAMTASALRVTRGLLTPALHVPRGRTNHLEGPRRALTVRQARTQEPPQASNARHAKQILTVQREANSASAMSDSVDPQLRVQHVLQERSRRPLDQLNVPIATWASTRQQLRPRCAKIAPRIRIPLLEAQSVIVAVDIAGLMANARHARRAPSKLPLDLQPV